jgi:hypothetical protein
MDARIKSGHDERVPLQACHKQKKAATDRPVAASCRLTLLLAVADAIDRTGPVVGDEDRAILGEDDVGGRPR